MKTWKRLLQTTCVAALVGATAMTVTASAAKAPLAKAPEKIPVILDADMVDLFDDGVALLILAQSPKVDLKGVTVVIGNSWVEDGVASTIRHLEGIGRTDIPVLPAITNRPGPAVLKILRQKRNCGAAATTLTWAQQGILSLLPGRKRTGNGIRASLPLGRRRKTPAILSSVPLKKILIK